MMTRLNVALAILLLAPVAVASGASNALLSGILEASPEAASIERLGEGMAVVFTPDLSVKENCRFFEALGFACFETPDWLEVIRGVHDYNTANRERPIRTVILETHGTNGNGLKLQRGSNPSDARSYISVGALQELLEPAGVRNLLVTACNSGRLLRPEIYFRLDRNNGDRLFLPATIGIYDATDFFDPTKSRVKVITPAASQIETTLVGSLSELSPATRAALERVASSRGATLPKKFAISEFVIQILLRDPTLELRSGVHVTALSREQTSATVSERLFRQFLVHLDSLAHPAGAARSLATGSH